MTAEQEKRQSWKRRYIVRDIYGREPAQLIEIDLHTMQGTRKALTDAEADAMEKAAHARRRARLENGAGAS